MMLRLRIGVKSIVLALVVTVCAGTRCLGQQVHTLRYDLPDVDLALFGNELVFDFLFPAIDAEIVETRFDLEFAVDPNDSFDAADIGLILQPPIDDPVDPDDRVLTLIRTGRDFGWSGGGDFSFQGATSELNGPILEIPPGAGAMLYGVTLFHADRLTDPAAADRLGGRFVASAIEVDYIAVPEPETRKTLIVLLAMGGVLFGRACVSTNQ